MFGRHPSLKTLETRKQLLAVEAELHRQHLRRDLEIIHQGLESWREQLHTAGTFLSSTGRAVAAMAEFKRNWGTSRNGKSGFFSKIAAGARMASTAWRAFRSGPPE